MEWASILAQLEGQTKQKLQALDQLQAYVQHAGLLKDQVSALLDLSSQLLGDNNYKVALKLLNCWEEIAGANRDVIRPYVGALLPPVVDRLSDNRQDVRQAACNLLLELLHVQRPDLILEKLGRFWGHKHWKVRHGLLQFVAEAVATSGEPALVPPRDESAWVVHKAIQLVGDPESAVRDAAIECLEEVYKVIGEQLVDVIASHHLRPAHLNAIYARLAALGADVAAPAHSGGCAGSDASPGGSRHVSMGHADVQQAQQQCSASFCAAAGVTDNDDTASSMPGVGGAPYGGYEDEPQQEEQQHAGDYDAGAHAAYGGGGAQQQQQHMYSVAAETAAGLHTEEQTAVVLPASRFTSSSGGGRQQQQQQLAAEDSGRALDGGRSWGGSSVTAVGASKAKRGGYKDGGGVSADGVLPEAPAICVGSERDLRAELDHIASTLGLGADWEKRVSALVRLEGLVKGGAAGAFEATFLEALRGLKDALLAQALDRRSAVARQAAHAMDVLAAGLGCRFEPLAAPCLLALFKALVITVQVVSEAADSAVRGILHHCRAPRLVHVVCDVLTGDKSAKLRQHCSGFLLQVLEEWDPSEYGRQLDVIEAGLTVAVQDALGDTRASGRAGFAAYAAAVPDRAAALLRRLDGGLQAKLNDALAAYARGGTAAALARPVSASSQRDNRQHGPKPWRVAAAAAAAGTAAMREATDVIVVASGRMGPPVPAPTRPPRSSRIGGTYQRAPLAQQQQQQHAPQHVPPSACSSVGHAQEPASSGTAAAAATGAARAGRKSVAGMPMRVLGPVIAPDSTTSTAAHAATGYGTAAAAGAAAAGAATGSSRRTSVAPQRVPAGSAGDTPRGTMALAALLGPGGPSGLSINVAAASKPSLVGELGRAAVPGSPDSVAHSEASVGDGQAGGGYDGGRPFQQPHQHQLKQQLHQHQPGYGSQHVQSAASDDNVRDQQHYYQQPVLYQHDAHSHAHQQHLAAQPSGSSLLGVQASLASLGAGGQGLQRPATLARAVAAVAGHTKDWKERVDQMNALVEVLARQAEAGCPPEAYAELDKALPKLLVAADDAHFKVSLAALAALQACLNIAPHTLEPLLDRLMPLLFLKLCGAKQAVRSAAEAALQACAVRLDADTLLPALIRALEAMKQPAARVSVMEFTVLFLGEGKVAGVPASTTHVRHWVSKNVPLLLDKNPNVRAMASRALATMYGIDAHAVASCLQHASPQEVAAVQRSIVEAEAEARAAQAADEQEEAGHAGQLPGWAAHFGAAASASSSMDASAVSVSAGAAGGDAPAVYGAAAADAAAAQALQGAMAGLSMGHVRQQQLPQQGAGMESARQAALHSGGAAGSTTSMHGSYRQPAAVYGGTAAVAVAAEVQPGLHHEQLVLQQLQAHAQPFPQPAAEAGSTSSSPGRVPAAAATAVAAAGHATASRGSASGLEPESSAADMLVGGSSALRPAGAAPRTPEHISGAAAAAAAAAAAGDAGSQARHLTLLVHRLQSRASEEVLAELAACAGTMCKQAWEDNFSKVLLAGLSAAQHSHEHVRELAFLLVLGLARHQAELFEPVLDVVLQPLLQGCADESREVCLAAQQALDALMAAMPPLRCASILAHKLPSEGSLTGGTAVEGEVLCATIRCLQLLCQHMPRDQLLAVAPGQLLPGLFAAFQHSRPDVRKAVVFCLVDMWHAAGDGLTPHLASLSSSQLKLLTIYYNRSQTQTRTAAC